MMWDQYDNGTNGGWAMMNGGSGALAWVMLLLMFVLLAAVIVTAVVALRHLRPIVAGAPAATQGVAYGVLDERYARGEIDEDEYRRRRAVLLEA